MKALSIRQPWAGLIQIGDKTIEVRTWPTKYRGDILICSSKSGSEPGLKGYALCIAEIWDCRPMKPIDEDLACCNCFPGAYSFRLRNIRPLKNPFPVKGKLGIFNINIDQKLLEM